MVNCGLLAFNFAPSNFMSSPSATCASAPSCTNSAMTLSSTWCPAVTSNTRRAMAVAFEQEQVAEVMGNRAKLVLAEAEVPKAMADAFRSGNLGILDYYRMKNIDSDTKMRTQIAAGEEYHVQEERDKGKVKE